MTALLCFFSLQQGTSRASRGRFCASAAMTLEISTKSSPARHRATRVLRRRRDTCRSCRRRIAVPVNARVVRADLRGRQELVGWCRLCFGGVAGYYHPEGKAGEARYALHRSPCCELDTNALMLGFAGVREMYEGRIEVLRYSATPVGRTNRFAALAHISSNRSGRQPMRWQVRASCSRCRWRLASRDFLAPTSRQQSIFTLVQF